MENSQAVKTGGIISGEGIIFRFLIGLGMISLLTMFVGLLFAPVFGPIYRGILVYEYAVDMNCTQIVEKKMKSINQKLWIVCILAWTFLILLNFNHRF